MLTSATDKCVLRRFKLCRYTQKAKSETNVLFFRKRISLGNKGQYMLCKLSLEANGMAIVNWQEYK